MSVCDLSREFIEGFSNIMLKSEGNDAVRRI